MYNSTPANVDFRPQGTDATLTLKNGEQFTGVFSGSSTESSNKSVYILKMVKKTRLASHQHINGNTDLSDEYIGEGEDHVMVFDAQDTADLAVANVVTAVAHATQNGKQLASCSFSQIANHDHLRFCLINIPH